MVCPLSITSNRVLIFSVMARICEICGKGSLKGNLVSRGIGRRVTNRSIRRQQPNLRKKRIEINGEKVKIKLCTSCLKRIKFENRKLSIVS